MARARPGDRERVHIDSWTADRIPRWIQSEVRMTDTFRVRTTHETERSDRPEHWPAPRSHRDRELMPVDVLPRKEVIQPQLPLRLPCYDFVPVASPTLGACFPKVSSTTSGVTNFHDVTGGVYKARERIHRSKADLRLLATPASCRRVAACNPN